MNLRGPLIPSYKSFIDDAPSFLRLLITPVLPLAGFGLLIVALSAIFKPLTSAHSTQD